MLPYCSSHHTPFPFTTLEIMGHSKSPMPTPKQTWMKIGWKRASQALAPVLRLPSSCGHRQHEGCFVLSRRSSNLSRRSKFKDGKKARTRALNSVWRGETCSDERRARIQTPSFDGELQTEFMRMDCVLLTDVCHLLESVPYVTAQCGSSLTSVHVEDPLQEDHFQAIERNEDGLQYKCRV